MAGQSLPMLRCHQPVPGETEEGQEPRKVPRVKRKVVASSAVTWRILLCRSLASKTVVSTSFAPYLLD